MKKTNDWRNLIVIGALCLATTCFAEYTTPVVLNCSTAPIRVTLVRNDGKVNILTIPVGSDLWQPVRGSQLTRIESLGGVFKPRSLQDLVKLRDGATVQNELWIVEDKRIDLVDVSTLPMVRRRCQEASR